ncbi:MAG: hypothetical protein UT48_C0006G0030 [Parcubacteria group bacterium GW2011_GWE2_39_37]|uniref:N-formylglutamate amidohydrolase n=1 Tax=Candidatus Falkowbacteria bacterium GW2011_GWF2_39_8 TaxID=1618642 RepID=A0A0G0Q982_9BACT|nr:MAG: hypothetical protein UT48_C0006G0030 [Parcubacteria group bacterium GW2011_GWE2_39_37]KKR33891.1 MAG: hypothetical protein UT64_C0002G0030 [Candidatus Falkowbacteria bacterium GW2011_GWF2_39_8]
MKKIILHIPHSSTNIPIKDGYVVSDVELRSEMIKLTDWHTDDLFQHKEAMQIITPFSRLFCDVERFPEDKDEVMAKVGMGMIYTNLDNGKVLRSINAELRNKIYKQFYQEHHSKFLQRVEEFLGRNDRCLIIDCHSFSSIPFERDLNKTLPRPDICIGTDDFHTPKTLVDATVKYFENNKLSCKVNMPYAGTIVPLKYYLKDKCVQSIMIEVNRNLYLEKNSNEKNKNYKEIKEILNGYIDEAVRIYKEGCKK